MPYADVAPVKIPDGLTDEQVALSRRHLPDRLAGRGAVRHPADRHGRGLGRGPVGQFAIRSALMLGAEQVVCIDNVPERLDMARAGGAITIDFDEESVLDRLQDLTAGKGPDKCIDAVGMEAHALRSIDSMIDRVKQSVMIEKRPRRTCCAR